MGGPTRCVYRSSPALVRQHPLSAQFKLPATALHFAVHGRHTVVSCARRARGKGRNCKSCCDDCNSKLFHDMSLFNFGWLHFLFLGSLEFCQLRLCLLLDLSNKVDCHVVRHLSQCLNDQIGLLERQIELHGSSKRSLI